MSEPFAPARAQPSPSTRPTVQVYVSNAWADRELARRIANLIEAQGYLVWWERDLGAPESGAAHAAATAPCVIALWSRASLSSRWVLEEAEAAAARGALLEVLIDPVASPLEKPGREPLALLNWSGDGEDSPAWKTVMARVRSLAGGPLGRPISRVPASVAAGLGLTVAAVLGAVFAAPGPHPPDTITTEREIKIEPALRGVGGEVARLSREPESAGGVRALPTAPAPEGEASAPAAPEAAALIPLEDPPAPAQASALVMTTAAAPAEEPLGPMP